MNELITKVFVEQPRTHWVCSILSKYLESFRKIQGNYWETTEKVVGLYLESEWKVQKKYKERTRKVTRKSVCKITGK